MKVKVTAKVVGYVSYVIDVESEHDAMNYDECGDLVITSLHQEISSDAAFIEKIVATKELTESENLY